MTEYITVDSILEKLKVFKYDKFTFEPIEHVYHLDGVKLTSATGYLDRFVVPFDREGLSKSKAAKLGITQEDMLIQWDSKRDRACDIGSMAHEYIEHFYEGKKYKTKDEDVINKIRKFHTIYENKLKTLTPISSEVRLFSRRWPICGTLDQLFLYEGQIIVGDWKTNEKIKTDKDYSYNKYLLGPFSKLKENELNKYSIQISLYQLILEEAGIYSNYGFICHLPHGDDEPQIYRLHNFKNELRAHLDNELHLTGKIESVKHIISNKEKMW